MIDLVLAATVPISAVTGQASAAIDQILTAIDRARAIDPTSMVIGPELAIGGALTIAPIIGGGNRQGINVGNVNIGNRVNVGNQFGGGNFVGNRAGWDHGNWNNPGWGWGGGGWAGNWHNNCIRPALRLVQRLLEWRLLGERLVPALGVGRRGVGARLADQRLGLWRRILQSVLRRARRGRDGSV